MSSTVFVLGAGFTKAFLPQAPLLVDSIESYHLPKLLDDVARLPFAVAVLSQAINRTNNTIDIEQLMTRLTDGMPHDLGYEEQAALLLRAIRHRLLERLYDARSTTVDKEVLDKFAHKCVTEGMNCITFNYDDVFDEALFQVYTGRLGLVRGHAPSRWHPNGGYGFFCKPSESLIIDDWRETERGSMHLLKLHGSMNWYPMLGAAKPYAIGSIVHHSPWWWALSEARVGLNDLKPFIDPEPFMVPPILSKSALRNEPILGLLWRYAFEVLRAAHQVVFIGYSMPITDITARFLFKEALFRPESELPVSIRVVDFEVKGDASARDVLKSRYRSVAPEIADTAFFFNGAASWLRDFVELPPQGSGA